MKTRWGSKPLGDLCDFQRGLTYSKKDETDQPGTTVLRATNIDLATNLLDLSDLRFIRDSVPVPTSKRIKPERLLICTASGSKSHLGKVAYIDVEADYAFGGFMGMLTPKADLLPRYLFHAMTAPAYKAFIGSLTDGANINNLRFDSLARFSIPVPPLTEQRRIVAILDEAFEGIAAAKANSERNLRSAKTITEAATQALLASVSSDAVDTTIGAEADILAGFAFKSRGYSVAGDDVRLLRGDNIIPGGLRWEDAKRWSKAEAVVYQRYALSEGDAVLAMDRPWVSAGLKRARITKDDLPCLLVQRVARLRAKHRLDSSFLYHLLGTQRFISELLDGQTGTGVPHISGKQIADHAFALPTLAEQRRAAAAIDALLVDARGLESIVTNKLAALDELKASLLHQAFTGQL